MMKTFACLFLCLLIFQNVFSQQVFESGYLIKNNGDTVRGLIKNVEEADFSGSVKIKTVSGEIREYRPGEISAFLTGGDKYVSKRFVNTAEDSIYETAFVKQLVSGEYDLYVFVKPSRRFYLLQKDSTQYFLYDLIVRNSGQIVQEGNFFNYLHFISINCPGIADVVDRVVYNDQEMSRFVIKTDQCLSQGKATSFYQNPKTSIEAWFFAGGFPVSGKTQFTGNFMLRLKLPKIDNRSSLNIGVVYSYSKVQSTERNDYFFLYTLTKNNQVVSIPVTFQYNFTSKRVQPYLYLGLSVAHLHKTTNSQNFLIPAVENNWLGSPVLGLGIEVRLAAGFFLRADWRYEALLQNPAIGIAYRF